MSPNRSFTAFSFSIICVLLLGIAGCGGGGGGSSAPAADPTAVFPTQDPDVDEVGESKRFDLSGTATQDGLTESLTGSITVSRNPNEVIDNQEVTVDDSLLVVRFISLGATISVGSTTYATLSGEFISTVDQDGVICLPDANYRDMPTTVKIGDAGVLGSVTCSDGASISASYLVEVSDRNRAWAAIRQYATYSESGTDIYEDIAYHVSTDGRVRAVEFLASDGALTLTLESP